MMRCQFFLSLALGLVLYLTTPAWAHRVNIFAFVDGNEIQVECSFNRSQKVKQGKVEVRNTITGLVVAEGKTDDAGVFRFAITPDMRQAANDLQVRIVAGEGHQNDWIIEASEFAATPTRADVFVKPSAAPPIAVRASPSAPESGVTAAAVHGLSSADIERIVNAALDAKLSPIKHQLAAQAEAGPTLKDIIGGMGWIFGLVGVAAYFRRRP